MERFLGEQRRMQPPLVRLADARYGEPKRLPNNLGPTLLIATGLLAIPVIIGFPLVLIGLARLKSIHGTLEFPRLAALHHQLLGWRIR
jgi:hypothetical protein